MIQPTKHLPSQRGFTLIELMMALSFVSFLLLFVFFAMSEVMGSYNKGLTVKQINQTARTVAEDMSRTVRSVDTQAVNLNYMNNGRLCLGSASYVWNTAGSTANKFQPGGSGAPTRPNLTMVRVEDTGSLCTSTLPNVPFDKATELLSGNVWVQSVQMTIPNDNLINIALTLSTGDPNAPTGTGPNATCPGGRNGQFCAVAQFSTTVSTRNGGQ